MNKTFNINLGGYPFAIDEDAYDYVQRYLEKIRNHFVHSDGCEEIIYDIEVRMAELFQEHLKGKSIVSMKEVDEVVMIMGKPEDFGAEPMEEGDTYTRPNTSNTNKQSKRTYGTGKRLFRDPEDKKVGGVCSGIAAYFGVEDPLWIRLIFVLLFFIGISPFIYFVLWVLVPEATTTSDRLAMRGEPTTINNIAKEIEKTINDLGERINEWGNEVNEEFGPNGRNKKKSKNMNTDNPTHKFVSDGVNGLGTALGSFFGALGTILRGSFRVIAIGLTAILAVAWIASMMGIGWASPIINHVGPKSSGLSYLMIGSAILIVSIPLLGMLLSFIKSTWSYRINPNIKMGLWAAWFLSILTGSYSGMKTAKEFSSNYSSTSKREIPITGDLTLASLPDIHFNNGIPDISGDNQGYPGMNLSLEDLSFEIKQSEDDKVYVVKEISSQGENKAEAKVFAEAAQNDFKVENNTITFDPNIAIPKVHKFRGQDIKYLIYIPAGKKFVMDDNFRNELHASSEFSWDKIHHDNDKQVWSMTTSGVTSPEYKDIKKDISTEPFSKLFLEGGIEVNVKKGTRNFIKFNGDEEYIKLIEVENINGILTITAPNDHNIGVEVNIELTDNLELVQTEDLHSLVIKGLDQKNFKLVSSNDEFDAGIEINGSFDNCNLTFDGNQEVEFKGTVNQLVASLDDNVEFDGSKFIAQNAKINGTSSSNSKIHVINNVELTEDTKNITIVGNPNNKKIN